MTKKCETSCPIGFLEEISDEGKYTCEECYKALNISNCLECDKLTQKCTKCSDGLFYDDKQ